MLLPPPRTKAPPDIGPQRPPALLRAALDLVSDGVLVLDAELNVLAVNAAANRLLSQYDLNGRCLADAVLPPSRPRLRAAAHLLDRRQAVQISLEVECPAAANDWRRLQLELHCRPDGCQADDSAALIALIRPAKPDATAVEAGAPLLDFLTGLPTREALAARLQQAQRRTERDNQYAIIFVDLDDFKQINDLCGHLAGDAVLKQTAQRLVAAVRPGDLVARFGGDEFVVVVDEIDRRQVARLTRRIRAQLSAPLEVEGRWLTISASIGQAVGNSADDADRLLRQADQAMYRAKRAWQNRRPR